MRFIVKRNLCRKTTLETEKGGLLTQVNYIIATYEMNWWSINAGGL